MKIAFASDFHFEFYDNINIAKSMIEQWVFDLDTDMIVIAGDLHVGSKKVIKLLNFIYELYNIPIIYVPGNHEYYRSSFSKENANFYRNGITHDGEYYILLRNSVSFGDYSFLGCMGNIDGSYEHINSIKHGGLNDFHMIKDFHDHEMYGRGEFSFLLHNVQEGNIVITHTMPSPRCISDKYKGSVYNPCFSNDWSEIIYENEPKIWICGHTHDAIDIMIDDTHIVANPYGYPHENKNWKWKYIKV